MTKYVDSLGNPSILAGCQDGYIRHMDVQNPMTKIVLDDMLFDGSGGSAITMTAELPVVHFGIPAVKKALKWILLQADLPLNSSPSFNIAFDGANLNSFPITANDMGEEDYRVDVAGDNSQGFRPRIIFTDNSGYAPTIYGMSIIAWNYARTT